MSGRVRVVSNIGGGGGGASSMFAGWPTTVLRP